MLIYNKTNNLILHIFEVCLSSAQDLIHVQVQYVQSWGRIPSFKFYGFTHKHNENYLIFNQFRIKQI